MADTTGGTQTGATPTTDARPGGTTGATTGATPPADAVTSEVCEYVVAVTEGRVNRSVLDADSLLWSHDGDRALGLDSVEIIALIYRLEEVSGGPLPAQFELMTSVSVRDVAELLTRARG